MAEDDSTTPETQKEIPNTKTPTTEKSPIDFLNDLRKEREQIEKIRDDMRKITDQQIQLQTRMEMGGTSYAGKPSIREKTAEEKANEEAEATVKRLFGR